MRTEAAGGAMVLGAALVAFAWANSPWKESYFDLWHARIAFRTPLVSVVDTVGHLVNDGLMAIFFFVIGLETKRELLHGQLSSVRRATLPVAAALGGMVVPALIYAAFNLGGDGAKGWGIPMATDIAFALGVLAIAGNRVPFALKVFLLALAVVDDIGAILVIAVFYTESLSGEALAWAAVVLALILAARAAGIRSIDFYVLLGAAFWLAVYKSGVHATIAGVTLAALTPSRPHRPVTAFRAEARRLLDGFGRGAPEDHDAEQQLFGAFEGAVRESAAPLERLERQLHPWVVFVIVPIFALANAGLEISGGALSDAATSGVTGGVVFGLLLGKPVGIVLASFFAVRLGMAALPEGTSWAQLAGAGVLAGIGFTVSLFITGLAFDSESLQLEAKIGILGASLVAAVVGYLLLRLTGSGGLAARSAPPQGE